MDRIRHRLTVMPTQLALFMGVLLLPALNIFRVDSRGLGHEHALPWRQRTSGVAGLIMAMLTFRARMRLALSRAQRARWFMPAATLAAVLLALVINRDLVAAAPIAMTTLTEGQHAGEFLISERLGVGAPSRETITVLSGQDLAAGAVIGRVSKGIGRVSIPTVTTSGSSNGTVSKVFAGPEVEVGTYTLTCTATATNGGTWSLTTPSGKTLPSLVMTAGSGTATNYRSRHLNFTITDGSGDFEEGDVFSFVVSTTAPTVIGGTGTGTISALALGPEAVPGNYRVICTEAITNGGRWQVYRGGPDGGVSIGSFLMSAGSGTATSFETREISFTLTDATDFIVGNYFDVCVFNQLSGGKVVAWDPTVFDGRNVASGVLFDNVDASLADAAGVIVARDAAVLTSALQWGTSITSSQKESAYLDLLSRGIVAR